MSKRRTSPRHRRHPWPLLALIVASLLTAASCGVPLDDVPQAVLSAEIDKNLLPVLLEETEPIEQVVLEAVSVHLVNEDGVLTPVTRSAEASPRGVLDALLAGPNDLEEDQGLSTNLDDVQLMDVSVAELQNPLDDIQSGSSGVIEPASPATANIAFVSLSFDSLALSTRAEQVVAFGQMVYTLTALDEIQLVSFTRDGSPISVPTGDGKVLAGTGLDRTFFSSLTPRPPVQFADETGRQPTNIRIYFVNSQDKLQPVGPKLLTNPERLLEDLILGPSVVETSAGLTTVIGGRTRGATIVVANELQQASIDLTVGNIPDETDATNRRLALGQIVYTMAELANVAGVFVSVDGVPQGIDGPVTEPLLLTPDDFDDLLAFSP